MSFIVDFFSFIKKYYPYYLEGAKNTILIALFTVILGTLLGTLLALMRLSKKKTLRAIASSYIEFIRGTPVYVQILVIYYGLSTIGISFPEVEFLNPIIGMNFSDFMSCVITLSINSAAYVAEIIRAGIQAVDKGQMEAARSLGMKHGLAMREIIIPQAVKNILPALGNEFVTVIKESSIVSVIGIGDLMKKATNISGKTYMVFLPYLVVAIVYFIITFSLSKLISRFERRMKNSD
ncbi:amino acid ABC transporter permease [Clostridium thermarum]|uniref:amino acid ABC transporter permease n=1 Tax=Clostridium thermarum TaxID=1716543 RepID=UPI00311A953E